MCFVVVVVVFKVVRVKKVVFEDGEEWSADVDEGWRLSVAWPPAPAGLLREQRRLELADAKRRGRARGRFALELGRARNRRRRRAVPLQSVRRSGYHPLAECVVVAASFKALFFVSSLFESVAFSHSRLARSRRRKRKPSFCESSLFVSLPWSTRTTTTTKSFSDETRATRNRGCRCSLFLSNVSRLTLRTSSPPSSLRLRASGSNENRRPAINTTVRRDAGEQIESTKEQRGLRVHRRWVTVATNYGRAIGSVEEIFGIERVDECEDVRRHRYWKPFTEEAIENIKRDRITRLVVLPLYPQFSISTSGSSLRLLEKIFREDPILSAGVLQHTVIPSGTVDDARFDMAKLIKNTLESDAFKDAPDKPVVFFSAHGVPTSYVSEGGDPYKDEMEECVKLIANELKRSGAKGTSTFWRTNRESARWSG